MRIKILIIGATVILVFFSAISSYFLLFYQKQSFDISSNISGINLSYTDTSYLRKKIDQYSRQNQGANTELNSLDIELVSKDQDEFLMKSEDGVVYMSYSSAVDSDSNLRIYIYILPELLSTENEEQIRSRIQILALKKLHSYLSGKDVSITEFSNSERESLKDFIHVEKD